MGTVLTRLTDVTVRYGSRDALRGISLELRSGQQLAVLGPSGSGKSTLLRLLAHELRPTSGVIEAGADGLRLGMVRQEPLLFGWLSVAENVALGQRYRANQVDEQLIAKLMDLVGVTELADAYPDQISGGQAQRVACARALAIDPDLLLLDEPFSALDPATREELQLWLRAMLITRGLTSVLVTHDIDEALIVADRIVLVKDGLIGRSWDNSQPAVSPAAALRHPLRSALRAAYCANWEPGDEEFSGVNDG